MAWEPDKNERTLYVIKYPAADKKWKYSVHPFIRVVRKDDGFEAMEPLPALTPIYRTCDIAMFDKVEFIDAPIKDRLGTTGEMGLINKGQMFGVRTTLESAS